MFFNQTQALTAERFHSRAQVYVNYTHEFNYFVLHTTYSASFQLTRRLQRRSLRLPTRSKSAQNGHLCTTAQAGADPCIFVCTISFKTNWDTYSLRIISCLVQVLSHNFSPPRPPPRSMLLCCMQKL